MKTLQEQYNLIKEGKGHKGVFLKEAKRLFPNIVPNAAGFDQASKLLKQRSIINENVFPLMPSAQLNPFTRFDKFVNEEVKATETKTTKEVEEAETKTYDYKDPKNLDNQIFDQYINGLRFEMEQDPKLLADNPSEAMLKAKDTVAKNLAKDSLYYTKNAAFGIKDLGYETSTEPKEPTGKFKSSGYGDLKENKMRKSEKLVELLEEAVAGIPSIGNPFADRKKKSYEEKFASFLAEEETKTMEGEGEVKEEEETKPVKKEAKKQPKEVVAEIEKLAEMAANKTRMESYTAKMQELKQTLETINEDENLAEYIDAAKTKTLEEEVKIYEEYFKKAEEAYNYSNNN